MNLPATLESSTYVRLDGPLTIAAVDTMQTALLSALDSGDDLDLELDESSPCDLALVQVLCAAHLSAMRRGQKIRLTGSLPAAVLEMLQRVGFDKDFSCGAYTDHGCLLAEASV